MIALRRRGPRLNWQVIVPIVAGALGATGAGMLVCVAVAALGDGRETGAFALPAAIVLPVALLGLLGARRLPAMPLRARDGFVAVTLAWVAAAAAGAAPFLLADALATPLDGFFESMSGFTTTGATLIGDVDGQPDAILLWRSLAQYTGGIGIVVLVVAVAPATGLATQRVFYAESATFTDDRLTPRIADTAKIVVSIYAGLTAAGFLAFLAAGMGAFDAVNHTMTSVATGGFSTRTASIAAFDSLAVELVAILFMVLGGVNFAFYYQALRGRSIWPQAAEVRLYLLLLALSSAAVAASLAIAHDEGLAESLRDGAFSVVSLMTSTGYTTEDYDAWNDFARSLLVLLMFVGGCAGSTAGGMKVIRILLLAKTAGQEVQRQLQPKAVQVLRTRGRIYSEELRRGLLGFFFLYMAVAAAGTLALTIAGLELTEAASGVASTLNIVGPALGDLGAAENFDAVPAGARAIFAFLMLAGRLEVFTVLVLLTPVFWRRNVA